MDAVSPLLMAALICVSGAELQSSVERPCPGENVVFTCALESTAHRWEIPSLGIARSLTPGDQDIVISDTPFVFTVTEVVTGTSITSTATVTAATNLNGTLVVCQDGNLRLAGKNNTINLRAPPTAPGTLFVTFPIPEQQFAITWNESQLNMHEMIDTYYINISGLDNLCGSVNTLQRFGSSTRNYTCLGWTMPPAGQMYTFTVQAANCGGVLRGPNSGPVTVSLQAPNPPTLTVTPLYDTFGDLLEIQSQATKGFPVMIADGVDGSPVEYIFSYGIGSPNPLPTGSNPRCTSSSCQDVFRVTNSKVQQYLVSVAARNVVGLGTSNTLVRVDSTNDILNVSVDVGVPEITCQFLNGPVTSAACTIQYGVDPTYVNLPYTDSSNGTNVNNVTALLSTPLEDNTLYYYVISSVGVKIQGIFQTGCAVEDLGITGTTPDERCVGLQNSAQFAGGVVCYSDVSLGAVAVYICNTTHHLEGPSFRECQGQENSGKWSGSIPHCVADIVEPLTTQTTLSTGVAVGITAVVTGIIALFGFLAVALLFYCISKHRSQTSKPASFSHQQQQMVSSSNPLQRTGPEYAEIVELGENIPCRETQRIEVKQNEAYQPVQH